MECQVRANWLHQVRMRLLWSSSRPPSGQSFEQFHLLAKHVAELSQTSFALLLNYRGDIESCRMESLRTLPNRWPSSAAHSFHYTGSAFQFFLLRASTILCEYFNCSDGCSARSDVFLWQSVPVKERRLDYATPPIAGRTSLARLTLNDKKCTSLAYYTVRYNIKRKKLKLNHPAVFVRLLLFNQKLAKRKTDL